MKKQLWILGVAAISMLASCSGDEETSSSGSAAIDNGEGGISINSDVEIRLSSKAGGTRASLESDDNGLFEAEGLGIFCLANGMLSVNPNELAIDWTRPYAPNTNYSVWMDNVEADAVYGYNDDGNIEATNIVWTDGITRWYPVANWYNYHFYGYYPRVSDDSIEATSTRRRATISLDGTQDVIWGRTNSTDPLAYSAKYFRQTDHGDDVPGLEFQHKLMRLTFSCVPGTDAKGSIASALTMGVKSIAIKSVPSVGYLMVACYDDPSLDGTMEYDWASGLTDFVLKEADDADFGTNYHWVEETETSLGQGILLPVPPASMSEYRYMVEIVLEDKSGNEFVSEHPIELRNQAAYEAGVSYNVQLTINGPQEIYLNATLEPWVTDSDTILGVEL